MSVDEEPFDSKEYKYKRMHTIQTNNKEMSEDVFCTTCGRTQDDSEARFCSNSFHLTKNKQMTPAERIENEAANYYTIEIYPVNWMVKREGYIAGAKAEYNRAQQEIANHIAVNSLLTDSEGEADLANKLYVLTKENADLKEEIKQLKRAVGFSDNPLLK